MFKEWGFLLGEIWILLALAALVGLLAGWLIWGGRKTTVENTVDVDGLRAELDACKRKSRECEERLAAASAATGEDHSDALRAQLDACHDARSSAEAQIETLEAELRACRDASKAASAAPAAFVSPVAAAADAPAEVGTRPAALEAARNGQPDDLKQIKGVGPKLEKLCNTLGFWHFDQIAAWTGDEVAWVDENLEGFKGRVTRDEWVAQAKVLAAGGAPRA